MENPNPNPDFAYDERTGKLVHLHAETRGDVAAALFSVFYLLTALVLLFWQLFDIWIGRFTLALWLGYSPDEAALQDPFFRLVAYAVLGGGLGGVVNGIRSLLNWHVEWRAFAGRYFWKYVTAPWLGATLALFVLALVRSGLAVVGGDAPPTEGDLRQSLSTLVLGILSGYGAREVFVWLDAQVTRLFQVTAAQREVPDLVGLTRTEAEQRLQAGALRVGAVEEEEVADEAAAGKVIRQAPAPLQRVTTGGAVDLTVGRQLPGDGFSG